MNKIKTTKTIILAVLVVAGSLFTSCSKDDDKAEASIVGVWKTISSVQEKFINDVSQGKKPIKTDDKNYIIMTFKTDGTFIDFEENENESTALTDLGTYTIADNKLYLSWDGDSDIEEFEFSLSGNKLITVYTEEDPSSNTKYVITDTFNRQ